MKTRFKQIGPWVIDVNSVTAVGPVGSHYEKETSNWSCGFLVYLMGGSPITVLVPWNPETPRNYRDLKAQAESWHRDLLKELIPTDAMTGAEGPRGA